MASKALNATITIGGAVAGSFRSAVTSTKAQLGQVGGAIKRLESEQAMLTRGIRDLGRAGLNVDSLRQRYIGATAAVDRLRSATARLSAVEQAREKNKGRREEIRGQATDAIVIGATVAAPIIQAAQFQKAMIGVSKQVQGARDSNGQLTATYYDMAESIQEMGRKMPIATNDIADMVTAAARMGIEGKENILNFVQLSGEMATAFEMPADQLADQMGKIGNVFGIPVANIRGLADTINYLDDNAISKGGDIINVLQRIGGQAKAVGLSAKDAAALGSTFLSLGSSAEIAATASNAVMRELAIAEQQPKRFAAGLKEIGMTAKEVQGGMAKDAQGTIIKVLEKINKLKAEDKTAVTTQLFGKEYGDDVAKLAGSIGEYRRQIDLANNSAAQGSMQREYAAQLTLVTSQWQLMKNRVTELSVNIGTVLLPAVTDFFGVIGPVVSKIAEFARANPMVTKAVVGTVVALVGLRLATLGASYAMTFLRGGVLQVARVMAGARVEMALSAAASRGYALATTSMSGGVSGLASRAFPMLLGAIRAVTIGLLTNPIGLIVAGIATAGLLIYKNWGVVKAFMDGFWQGFVQGMAPISGALAALMDSMPGVRAAFDFLAGGVEAVWTWFKNLLEPVQATGAQLGAATSAGQLFGQTLGAAMNFAWTPMKKIIEGITWIVNNAGLVSGAVSGVAKKIKGYFTDDEPAKEGEAPAPQTPGLSTADAPPPLLLGDTAPAATAPAPASNAAPVPQAAGPVAASAAPVAVAPPAVTAAPAQVAIPAPVVNAAPAQVTIPAPVVNAAPAVAVPAPAVALAPAAPSPAAPVASLAPVVKDQAAPKPPALGDAVAPNKQAPKAPEAKPQAQPPKLGDTSRTDTDKAAPAVPGVPAKAAPPVPVSSSGSAQPAGPVIHDNSQTTIKITQQPGESTDALADRVAKRIEERKAVANRGAMYDGASQP